MWLATGGGGGSEAGGGSLACRRPGYGSALVALGFIARQRRGRKGADRDLRKAFDRQRRCRAARRIRKVRLEARSRRQDRELQDRKVPPVRRGRCSGVYRWGTRCAQAGAEAIGPDHDTEGGAPTAPSIRDGMRDRLMTTDVRSPRDACNVRGRGTEGASLRRTRKGSPTSLRCRRPKEVPCKCQPKGA
jgi:hypothetical protein